MKKTPSRSISIMLVAAVYLVSFLAATILFRRMVGMHPLWAIFLVDVAATLLVWAAGVLLGNSSVYDPYWSVTPLPIAISWAIGQGGFARWIFLAVLLVWGVRLTANWARRWQGLGYQDWRYTMYRTRMPGLWPVVNLFGIHLMPTVLVFLAMIPVFFGMSADVPSNPLTWSGALFSLGAVWLAHAADRQLDAYQRLPDPKPPIAVGLWKVCRHPNYLGEIIFWWGLWIIQVSLIPMMWTIIGPLMITVLFVFVSIPMMERHLVDRHPEYTQVIGAVPMLVPSPRQLIKRIRQTVSFR